MIGRKCCCKTCRCVGCMRITLAGPTAIDVECQGAIDASYEGRFTLWSKTAETRTPFDLIATGFGFCDDEAAEYPGTVCTFTASICCNPSPEDDIPTGPTEPEDPPPPPPPGPL